MSEAFSFAQNKHVLIKGFLTKSPPNQENESHSGHFLRDLTCLSLTPAFLKKKWRERYCVLYKVRKQSKTEVYFEYYKDAACSKLKGRVDLGHCKDIMENLKIDRWSNVFSVQTQHKGQLRTYYFSAPTQEIMSKWVDSLFSVTQRRTEAPTVSPFGRRIQGIPQIPSAHSPIGTVNSTWLGDVRGQVLEPHPEYDPAHGEDGYNDLWNSGVYYFSTEADDYHPLPSRNHSYVNLSGLDDNNTGKNEMSKRISCPNLAGDAPVLPSRTAVHLKTKTLSTAATADPVPPRPVRERGTAQTNTTELLKEPLEDKPTAFGDRRNSSNSVYLNMWETGDGDDYLLEPPPVGPKPVSQSPTNRPQGAASDVRTYRRSQFAGSELSPICPVVPTTLPTLKTPTVTSGTEQDNLSVPSKPPPPPRAVSTVISSLPIFPPNKNPIARVPSVEVCADLELPTRAPGLRDITDSSMESNSDSSLSISSGEVNNNADPLSTLKAPNRLTVPSGPSDNTLSATQLTTEPSPKAETRPIAGEPTKELRKSDQQQLNYIEPCNLELGSNNSANNATCTRPLTNRLPTTAAPPLHGNLSSSVTSHTGDPATSVSLGKSRLGVNSSRIPPDDDDYDRIEYKEIDPISTNALAIVTKHYLDGDTSPR